MTNIIFSSSINSEMQNIKPLVKDMLRVLISVIPNISKEDIMDIKLILSEAIANAIIHGNNKDKSKHVRIIAQILNKKTILLQVEDEGTGFNFKSILKDVKVEDLYKEDGRGFLLIDSLSDSIEFFKNGKEIHIYKTVHSNV